MATLNRQESDKLGKKILDHFQNYGWSIFSVTIPDVTPFAGVVGLLHVDFAAPFTPAVEVGWRFLPQFWGQGYATEGAIASLQYGFEELKLSEKSSPLPQ